jgi:Mn-dependent DtxR family transcriptional regulator
VNKKGLTPDERFLLKLYELSNKKGDPFQKVSCKLVAQGISQTETSVKNIVKLLAQANFIKKIGDTEVCLTQQGYQFVLNELE